jgi:tRNA/rRNA methyltransferase
MAEHSVQPRFVLVQPQMGENIGAAARAMLNFGLDRLVIVKPRDGWPNARADAMAAGAGGLLDAAVVTDSTAKAVADCAYVFATTARHRSLSKPVMTPARAMQHAHALCAQGQSVAVLFGPERAGLESHDVALCDAIISVPVNAEFASLNLSHCVLLTAYEWMRQSEATSPEAKAMATTRFASKLEVEKLGDHFEDRLSEAGMFFPAAKADSMKLSLRNMWARLALTHADVQTLHGMLRQMVRWKERG